VVADLEEKLPENQLPLIPMNVVLFPGNILPLNIFESRYKLMVEFCVEQESCFGVVLIKKGKEVGGMSIPYLVGTSVQIIETDYQEDGRINLITLGRHRFEILDLVYDRPYLVGEIRTQSLENQQASENLEQIALTARNLYENYETWLTKTIPDWKLPDRIPTSPDQLSSQIGTRLQITLREKQEMLEIFDIDQLLIHQIQLLKYENQRLSASLLAQSKFDILHPKRKAFWKNSSLN